MEELAAVGAVRILALAAEPGAAFVHCQPLPGHGEQMQSAVHTVAVGLRMLAKEYPGYVEEAGE